MSTVTDTKHVLTSSSIDAIMYWRMMRILVAFCTTERGVIERKCCGYTGRFANKRLVTTQKARRNFSIRSRCYGFMAGQAVYSRSGRFSGFTTEALALSHVNFCLVFFQKTLTARTFVLFVFSRLNIARK